MKERRGREVSRSNSFKVVVSNVGESRGRGVIRVGGRNVRCAQDSVDRRGEKGVCHRRVFIRVRVEVLHEKQ